MCGFSPRRMSVPDTRVCAPVNEFPPCGRRQPNPDCAERSRNPAAGPPVRIDQRGVRQAVRAHFVLSIRRKVPQITSRHAV